MDGPFGGEFKSGRNTLNGRRKAASQKFFVEHLWANHLYGMPFFVRHSDSQPGGGRAIWHFYHGHQRNGHFPFHCLLWHVQFPGVGRARKIHAKLLYPQPRLHSGAGQRRVHGVHTGGRPSGRKRLQCAAVRLHSALPCIPHGGICYRCIQRHQPEGRPAGPGGKNLCAARPGDAGGVCRRAGGHAPAAFDTGADAGRQYRNVLYLYPACVARALPPAAGGKKRGARFAVRVCAAGCLYGAFHHGGQPAQNCAAAAVGQQRHWHLRACDAACAAFADGRHLPVYSVHQRVYRQLCRKG